MLIDINDYLLGTRDQNRKYNFTSKYGLILNIKDQVNRLLSCFCRVELLQTDGNTTFGHWRKNSKS